MMVVVLAPMELAMPQFIQLSMESSRPPWTSALDQAISQIPSKRGPMLLGPLHFTPPPSLGPHHQEAAVPWGTKDQCGGASLP